MKRRIKKGSGVYSYLLSKGVLENGTKGEIQKAKQEYWREYKAKWRKAKRKEAKEFCISLNQAELRLFTHEAKRHKMSCTEFIKQTSLAYTQKRYVVPNSLEVRKIAQLLSMTHNLIQEVLLENKSSRMSGLNMIEAIANLEHNILPLLNHPKTIEEHIVLHIKMDKGNKVQLLKLINSL